MKRTDETVNCMTSQLYDQPWPLKKKRKRFRSVNIGMSLGKFVVNGLVQRGLNLFTQDFAGLTPFIKALQFHFK